MNIYFLEINKVIREIKDKYFLIFVVLIIVQYLAYTELYTGIVFTNHFVNAFYNTFPSYRTTHEARVLFDIIRTYISGNGQAFNMFLGSAILSVTALVFVKICGQKSKVGFVLTGLFLVLYPSFLDYWSFCSDNVPLALADLFAVVAMYCITSFYSCSRIRIANLFCAIVLCVCVLLIYPSRISMLLFVFLASFVLVVLKKDFSLLAIFRIVLTLSFMLIGICLLYLAVSKFILGSAFGTHPRSSLNTVPLVIQSVQLSYSKFYGTIVNFYRETSSLYSFACICLIVTTIFSLFFISKGNFKTFIFSTSAFLLMPIAVYGSLIVNIHSYDAPRIVSVYPYLFLLMLVLMGRVEFTLFKLSSYFITIIFVCIFMRTALENNTLISYKNIFEVNFVNRFMTRIEQVHNMDFNKNIKLIIVGKAYDFKNNFSRYPLTAHIAGTNMFIEYRHKEILNFFYGKDLFISASDEEKQIAKIECKSRPMYPAEGAMFLNGEVLTICFENKFSSNVAITW